MAHQQPAYFIPEPSKWPLVGAVALLCMGSGAAFLMNGDVPLFGDTLAGTVGKGLLALGTAILIYMLFGWFANVIDESEKGLYSKRVDISFRWSMGWFIFSEVFFFAAFFGALYYIRQIALPELGDSTHKLLWPDFSASWPTQTAPYGTEAYRPMAAWSLPTINTGLLLLSGVTVTWAHHAIVKHDRKNFIIGLAMTVALGIAFLCCQVIEYREAFHEFNLTLHSGVYGSLFFMLTGFHGLHVTLGTLMLLVVLIRAMRGHFKGESHFAFEAAAWYWHFVDVVWLILFVFIYVV